MLLSKYETLFSTKNVDGIIAQLMKNKDSIAEFFNNKFEIFLDEFKEIRVVFFTLFNMVELLLIISDKFWKIDAFLASYVGDLLVLSLKYTYYGFKGEILLNYLRTINIINKYLSSSVKGLDEEGDQENIY